MVLQQYYLGCLAHASYLVADEKSGVAAVVDPQRDVEQYLSDARRLGVHISHVFLTHFHADFVAGHLELRSREGAAIYLGKSAAAEYEFVPVGDGDSIALGPEVRIDVLETPGHSPESISLLVFDLSADAATPHAVLTGDTLFIGDVGRPDLRVALGWSAQELGGMLYDSLRDKLLDLPDSTLVYPAHGAGSLCGKNLSTDTVSTIGEQRLHNYALQPTTREDFIRIVTADQPETPAYFSYDAVLNAQEHPSLADALKRGLRPLTLDETLNARDAGAQLLDTRDAADFEGAHLAGSINIGLGGSYATWCGTLLDRERPVVVIADPGREGESTMRLGRIGFDIVAGHLEDGMLALAGRPDLVARIERVTADALADQLAQPAPPLVLDVRSEREWAEKRIEGSLNIPLNELPDRLHEVPPDGPLVTQCATGYRSVTAAGILIAAGFPHVSDLVGGLDAWAFSGQDSVHEAAAPLVVRRDEPFNAETPIDLLRSSARTPTESFFVRSHGPTPAVDPAAYRLTVTGAVERPLVLSLDDLRERFEHVEVTATLACAGNRRGELNAVATVPDAIPWGAGAVSTATWGGIRLADLLAAASVGADGRHVAFVGLDQVEADGGLTAFAGSVPLRKALAPDALLAYDMNGAPLPDVHGYPLRAVIPGYIGARSVKWLAAIAVQPAPSSSFFQVTDYALDGVPLGELPLSSVICHPQDGGTVPGPAVVAEGYAHAGGSRRVERVEVSADGGRTWRPATLSSDPQPGVWRFWRVQLEVAPGPCELIVRAFDSEGGEQPPELGSVWNERGYMNNAWHRASFQVVQAGVSARRAVA
ncbi:MAG: molybdopterin-dependent oxidoreductase [Gaiellales bacterium]